MFSKTFGYALRAVVYVAIHGRDGNKVSLQALSDDLQIPHHFLGKIMQDMVKHSIIDSSKGPTGGFFSNADTDLTPVLDVLRVTDGNAVFDSCALGIRRCNASNPCPLHNDFAACRNGMRDALSGKTIGILATEVREGKSYLVREA